MRKNILFVFFILLAVALKAQWPVLQWAQHIGGTSNTFGQSIVTDAIGNVYTAGFYESAADFDPGPGIFPLTVSGPLKTGVFISKLDPTGNFIWAKSITINYNVANFSADKYTITLDKYGNVYLTGYFFGTVDFDPGNNVFNLTSNGASDIFVLKLNGNGNFIWARSIGSKGSDKPNSITSDPTGNIYAGGYFKDTLDFDPGPTTYSLTSTNASNNAFILKLDSAGNFLWAKKTESDDVISLTTDTLGNIYSTGSFAGVVDFDPGPGVALLNSMAQCMYILKLDSLGNFLWAKGFGNGYNRSNSIKTDRSGNIYATGYFSNTIDFDPGSGTFSLTSNGSMDIFLLKLDPVGNFLWAKNMGGSLFSHGNSIFIDAQNNSYITGAFRFTADFDPGQGVSNLTSNGDVDIFILKLDSLGNFVWATNAGCSASDSGNDITIDNFGNIYTCGNYSGLTDFDPSTSTYNVPLAGFQDMFITKMGQTSVGLEENNLNTDLMVYPNPTKDIINIAFKNTPASQVQVELLDLFGQIQIHEISSAQHVSFSIYHLKNGIYILRIMEQDGSAITKKIIKK